MRPGFIICAPLVEGVHAPFASICALSTRRRGGVSVTRSFASTHPRRLLRSHLLRSFRLYPCLSVRSSARHQLGVRLPEHPPVVPRRSSDVCPASVVSSGLLRHAISARTLPCRTLCSGGAVHGLDTLVYRCYCLSSCTYINCWTCHLHPDPVGPCPHRGCILGCPSFAACCCLQLQVRCFN